MADYYELKIKINPQMSDPSISDILSDICFENFDCEGVVIAEEEYQDNLGSLTLLSTTEGTLKAYLTSPERVGEVLNENKKLLLSRGFTEEDLGSWEFEITKVENEDWSKKWKENWDVTHVSERIAVVPSWLEYSPKEDEITIKLDPGSAFGTGTHPTTQLCMRAVEKHMNQGDIVADIGMGSGILAICAAKFGAKAVYGCDNDELVIETARENAEMNEVSDKCFFECNTADKVTNKHVIINLFNKLEKTTQITSPLEGEVSFQCEQQLANIRKEGEGNRKDSQATYPSPEFQELVSRSEILPSPTRGEGQFDFVLANILHNVLAEIMGDLKNLMKANAVLVLSGILDEKKQVVLDAIEKHGLKLIEETHQNIWTGLTVKLR